MKKIIDGAKYDTTTAKSLGSDSYSNSNDFSHWREELYRTKSGKYFLHGKGGPMTKYAVSSGNNSWGGGDEIITMSREAAMEWAEEHLTADEYEEAFGEITEDGEVEQLLLNIPAALKSRLWAKAETENRSITAVVLEMLEKGI